MNIEDDLPYWLALTRAPLLSAKKRTILFTKLEHPKEIFGLKRADYQELGFSDSTASYLSQPDWRLIERELKWQEERTDHHIVTLRNTLYPTLLSEIFDPPTVLYVKGNIDLLTQPQLAIVGTRKPTPNGKENGRRLAYELTLAGLTITSGLAQGIDTAAHLGALDAGHTIAVIGTGINRCYPAANRSLANKIAENGAVVTEFMLDAPPLPMHFPQRNRLLSGLCLGTLVVEAAIKSGSLITAHFAGEQGREVFAIPSSIHNPQARGCHKLLKEGAKLVEEANDVLEELSNFLPKTTDIGRKIAPPEQITLDADQVKLLECVGYEPCKIDTLVERSNFSIPAITSILIDLELAGLISHTLEGYVRVF